MAGLRGRAWPCSGRKGHCLVFGTDVGLQQYAKAIVKVPRLLTTLWSDCGEERQELKAADGMCNLFKSLASPKHTPIIQCFGSKSPRELASGGFAARV